MQEEAFSISFASWAADSTTGAPFFAVFDLGSGAATG